VQIEENKMAIASRLGPWLLGTVKDTTGTTAGTVRNMGATPVMQNKSVLYTDITAATLLAVLPAGSMIQAVTFNTTTAYATTIPTIALFCNGVAINTAANSGTGIGSFGVNTIALGNNSAAGAALIANVGATDAVITFTQANVTATSGAGVLNIAYVVRNSDGTYGPNA
jgi:hypothetical protein